MLDVPNITKELKDTVSLIAKNQLSASRNYKQPRMNSIKESEDLYFGVVPRQLKNPFNYSIPFMPGFIDHYLARIDDPPTATISHQHEADYKLAQKASAAFNKESTSPLPHHKWPLKDRWGKKMALFSGRCIYKIFSERWDDGSGLKYRSNFSTKDYYEFHSEPNGGGDLNNHLFCGEDSVYRTKEQLIKGAAENVYDREQVSLLLSHAEQPDYKEVETDYQNSINRHTALGLDPTNNAYVGQTLFKLAEWYLTVHGVRWYCLFDEHTGLWVRLIPLREMIPSDLWPYTSWATHEEARLFWSKAPADDAKPIATYINKAVNQELYNREKVNMGQRAYDPTMFHDLEALEDWRPDGLVPVDTRNGTRNIDKGLFEFRVAGLNGTIDLIQFLDSFSGRQMGSTPGSQGQSEKDKKVGIYFGELQQVDEFVGLRNKSYKEAWEETVLKYVYGLEENLTDDGEAIKLMGPGGAEWTTISRKDFRSKSNRPFDIQITGGKDREAEDNLLGTRKIEVLPQLTSVNPKWRDRELLKSIKYTDEEMKDAFSMLPIASQELLSEAAQAIEDILVGKTPKLNRGANSMFMQKLIDSADNLDIDEAVANKIYDYAYAHADIAMKNEKREAENFKMEMMGAPVEEEKETSRPVLV